MIYNSLDDIPKSTNSVSDLAYVHNILLYLAKSLNLKAGWYIKKNGPIYIRKNSKDQPIIFYNYSWSCNDDANCQITKHKAENSKLLLKKGYPAPKFQIFSKRLLEYPSSKRESKSKSKTGSKSKTETKSESRSKSGNKLRKSRGDTHLYNLLDRITIKKPIVIKPTRGLKGIGVHLNLNNDSEILSALMDLSTLSTEYGKHFMIEEMIRGNDYRILMVNHQIVDCLLRKPAEVIGDGKHTIRQLIKIRSKTDPFINLNNQHIIDFVKRYQINLKQIPKDNYHIKLGDSIMRSNGAVYYRVPIKQIAPETRRMLCKVSKLFRLQVVGIDFICPNIKLNYKKVGGAINEINHRPGLMGHVLTDHKIDISIIKKLLIILFK